jgi:hypothetical protein
VCVCVLQEKRFIYLFYFLSDARLDFSREIRRTLKSCSIPVGTDFYFIYFLFLFCFVITENLEERSPECVRPILSIDLIESPLRRVKKPNRHDTSSPSRD